MAWVRGRERNLKNFFAHGRFPEVGQKQKTEKKKKKERERERLNDGDNNGQTIHGARKHAWRTQAGWANLYFLHASIATKVICIQLHICNHYLLKPVVYIIISTSYEWMRPTMM